MRHSRATFIFLCALLPSSCHSMSIVDALYDQPYAKDAVSTQLDLVYRTLSASNSATSVAVVGAYTVPQDRIFMLTSAVLALLPGDGQIPLYGSIFANVASNYSVHLAAGTVDGIADEQSGINFSGCVYLPPGAVISATANFDLDGELNSANLSVTGIAFPKGNFSLGG